MSEAQHEHLWTPVAHVDGCHWYSWSYGCTCGATRVFRSERDIEADGYSAVWMAHEGGERCVRCEQLMGGEKPQHSDEIVERVP